jgi:hypothetical protein
MRRQSSSNHQCALPPEKKWREMELAMQAAYHGRDDPEDALG